MHDFCRINGIKIVRILRIAGKTGLLVVSGYVLYLLSFCVMYPNTAINRLNPLYLDRGMHPADVANKEGNVEFRLGKNGPRFELPVGYMWSTIKPEMDFFKVSFDYETLEPASLYSKNPKHVTVQISAGAINEKQESWQYHDFMIFQKHGLLSKVEENIWQAQGPESYIVSNNWHKEYGLKRTYFPKNNRGGYYFLALDKACFLVECVDLCVVRIYLDNGYWVKYIGFHFEELANLPEIARQTKKFINIYSKD